MLFNILQKLQLIKMDNKKDFDNFREITSDILKIFLDKVEDLLPLSELQIPKKPRTKQPRTEEYDIGGDMDDNDDVDTDLIISIKSTTSGKIYFINLTKNSCTCPDFFWRNQTNPQHICKHLKEHFKNI
jgi:hypothetical protein